MHRGFYGFCARKRNQCCNWNLVHFAIFLAKTSDDMKALFCTRRRVHSFLHSMKNNQLHYNFRIHWASSTVRTNSIQLFLLAKSGPTEKCRFAWIGLIRFCVLIFHQEGFEEQKYGAGTKNQKTPKNTPITNCVMIIISTLVQQELQEKRKISKKCLLTIFSTDTNMWHHSLREHSSDKTAEEFCHFFTRDFLWP